MPMNPARIEEIRKRHAAATPGPWAWFGYVGAHQLYLASIYSGRLIVMDFERWGMQSAQPRFPEPIDKDWLEGSGIMTKAAEIARTKPYGDREILGFDNSNAVAIAESWRDIETLLGLLDEKSAGLRHYAEQCDALRAQLEDDEDPATKAFDAIAAACGRTDWGYPGQLVRDVEALAEAFRQSEKARVESHAMRSDVLASECDMIRAQLDEANERLSLAQDKALRFDLDRVGIEHRESEAIELVEARATIAEQTGIIARLRPALEACVDAIDRMLGDTDPAPGAEEPDGFAAMQFATAALTEAEAGPRSTLVDEAAALRTALFDTVKALELWGTWEGGIPEADDGAAGSLGSKFNRAADLLGLELTAAEVGAAGPTADRNLPLVCSECEHPLDWSHDSDGNVHVEACPECNRPDRAILAFKPGEITPETAEKIRVELDKMRGNAPVFRDDGPHCPRCDTPLHVEPNGFPFAPCDGCGWTRYSEQTPEAITARVEQRRRRGPLCCPLCGDPIEESPTAGFWCRRCKGPICEPVNCNPDTDTAPEDGCPGCFEIVSDPTPASSETCEHCGAVWERVNFKWKRSKPDA